MIKFCELFSHFSWCMTSVYNTFTVRYWIFVWQDQIMICIFIVLWIYSRGHAFTRISKTTFHHPFNISQSICGMTIVMMMKLDTLKIGQAVYRDRRFCLCTDRFIPVTLISLQWFFLIEPVPLIIVVKGLVHFSGIKKSRRGEGDIIFNSY